MSSNGWKLGRAACRVLIEANIKFVHGEVPSAHCIIQASYFMTGDPMAKVLFRVPDDDGGSTVETLWAIPLGDDHYKLDNSPFYAYDVSWEDIILAPFDAQEQFPTFQSVITRSGNRTIRVIFDPAVFPGNVSDQLLQGLVGLGCSYEGANPKYMSVNIPPAVELQLVRAYLVARNAQWEHADPTHAALFPDEA